MSDSASSWTGYVFSKRREAVSYCMHRIAIHTLNWHSIRNGVPPSQFSHRDQVQISMFMRTTRKILESSFGSTCASVTRQSRKP
eukprot:4923884-Amphidinium_carterae.2